MTASELPEPRFAPASADASHQIALELRRYLEREGLRPGDRIGTEQELAAEFGVSRPTLREGLRLLASSHLIRVGRGRSGGIFVARTPGEGMSRNVSESISMMLATEIRLTRRAARRAHVPRGALAGLAAAERDGGDARPAAGGDRGAAGHAPGTEPFNAADTRFHRALARGGGQRAAAVVHRLDPRSAPAAADRGDRPVVDADEILRQHRDIARAVRRRQPAAAEKAMRAHIAYLRSVRR